MCPSCVAGEQALHKERPTTPALHQEQPTAHLPCSYEVVVKPADVSTCYLLHTGPTGKPIKVV